MSDTLLRVEDLKIYYPVAGSGFGKKEFVKAVDGVTFEVKKGEVFGIVGESGCGKTTLLRILMGLETPDSGTVQGVENIGAVFQESRLCPQLTAVGNICLVGGVNPAQAQAELQTLGFTQAELALPVARLSGGQQRRTALLRALLCQPVQTLLLDEPFTGMDPELVSHAAAAVVRLAARRDTVLVTHDEHAADLLGWPVVRLETVGK